MSHARNPSFPKRWRIDKPQELGHAIHNEFDLDVQYYFETAFPAILKISMKLLATQTNSNWIFVGRSLDDVYYYLSGLLYGTPYHAQLNILNLSLAREAKQIIENKNEQLIHTIRHLFMQTGLTPAAIVKANHPCCFVDVVFQLSTFSAIQSLLHHWAQDLHLDKVQLRNALYWLGVKYRRDKIPMAYKKPFKSKHLQFIEIPSDAWDLLADYSSKVTTSHRQAFWFDDKNGRIYRHQYAEGAIQRSYLLFELGRHPKLRRAFCAKLSKIKHHQSNVLSSLMANLKKGKKPYRKKSTAPHFVNARFIELITSRYFT